MINLRTVSLILLLVGSSLLLTGCPTGGEDPVDRTDPIGVYNGTGVWSEFAGAVNAALDSLGRDVEYFDESDAQNGLEGYSMVVFGGGDPRQMASALGFTGRENILHLVESGGGFLGLGGGAYLAADTMIYNGVGSGSSPPIGLFNGQAIGPIETIAPFGTYDMTLVSITDTQFDPDLKGIIHSLYRGGPAWLIASPPAEEIAHFIQNDQSAGVIFNLGFGRVALLAFHPEIDENNPRDGTTFGDDLVDPESEWFLLRSTTEWCLREF
ncbi:hypothetical protein BMS3Bbin04_01564 [bacterium BMS3Bbin04]|nr:hypothetical protein BMS3Bbin04_01564 [bacterium BMS3Bbin04]